MIADLEHPDLLESGIYTVPEAAALVETDTDLVRTWVEGREGRQRAVIDNQLGRVAGKNAISFTNLMELRFVARFAAGGVDLREIRRIMEEAKATLARPHPFAGRVVFRTDGKKIVAEIFKRNGVEAVYDLRTHNYEFPLVVMDSLKEDVVFDPQTEAIRAWFPRKRIAPNVIVHPSFAFGRPVLKDSRVPTDTLARAVKVEGSATTVALLYDVPVKQVREAVAFERELRKVA